MAAQIAGVFEPSLATKIVNSKVLVVGAGGIGCEVLKNLVMSGFSDIEIVRNRIRFAADSPIQLYLWNIFRLTWTQSM